MDPEMATTTLPKRPLSVRVSKPAGEYVAGGSMAMAASPAVPAAEPLSPTARLLKDHYIVCMMETNKPIGHDAVRSGMQTIARHPRFCSIQTTDDAGGTPRWLPTTVNVDDHIVVPRLDDVDGGGDPERALEDYVACLSTLPMDFSRPLWEVHLLNFPITSTAGPPLPTIIFRFHHSLGDGTSLMSLLLAVSRSAASPDALPSLPPTGRRKAGQMIYSRPRPPRSAGVLAFAVWIWSLLVLCWNTMVDVALSISTTMFLSDPDTPFKQSPEKMRVKSSRRAVHRSLSLDDIKYIKNAMNCKVTDVLFGVTSAALSRYYFRKIGDTAATKKNICIRALVPVNMRSAPGLQALADMLDSSKSKDAAWGNKMGYILLPLHIALYNDPLEYVRKAKKTADRKKSSLQVFITHRVVEITTKLFGVKATALALERTLSHTTLSISSLMGPVEKIQLFGHPIASIAPTTFGLPEALSLTFQSYMNTVRAVLLVDDTKIPDYHVLLDDMAISLQIIRDAVSKGLDQEQPV